MAQMKLLLCFLITLTIDTPLILSAPTYLTSICANTTMFATKSQYETNLNTVFGYLSGNATNPSGFHAAQAGHGTKDFVYAHFLCRGDQGPSSCHDCVTNATTSYLPDKYCPNRKNAIIWYDECMVRYSNESFFGVLDLNNSFTMYNVQNVTGNVSRFMDVMDNMMSSIVHRASNGGPRKKYATNYAPFSSLVGIYGLEQCTPDLTAGDCQQCLQNAVGSLPTSQGGRTILPSCDVRFEITPFFKGADKLPPPPSLSPSLPPSLPPSPTPSLPPSLQPSLPSSPAPESTSNSTGTSISNSGKIKTSSTKLISIIVPTTILIWLTLNLP